MNVICLYFKNEDEKEKNLSYKLINENENFYLMSNGTLKLKKLNKKHESFVFDVSAIDNGKPSLGAM